MAEPIDRRVIRLSEVQDIPFPAGYVAPEEHSWQPRSLVDLAANPPEPPTIGGLLYPGERTVLSGETESMKTWLALILCKAEMELGMTVGWADVDAMGPGAMFDRLKLLGCEPSMIHSQFLYYQPHEMLDPAKIGEVAELVAARSVRMFVIDAFNPFLSMHGLEPNSTPDIDTFWRTIADPLSRAGAAPVLLDHVVKNAENRGKYSYGSERKASGAHVHLGFRLLEPLTKGGKGKTLLTVHKDRPGYLPRPTLGRLVLESDGTLITFQIVPDHAHDAGGWRPSIMMEKGSRFLENQDEPVSKNICEEHIGGKADARRKAIQFLIDDGYVRVIEGPKNSHLLSSVRAFREADLPPDPELDPVRPEFDLSLGSHPARLFDPPPRGVEHDGRPGSGSGSTSTPGSEVIREYDWPPDLYLESIAGDELETDVDPDPGA
jgi:hypothetical protein